MDFEKKEVNMSGLTEARLSELGITKFNLRSYLMVAAAKYITDFTKHPGGLPNIFGVVYSKATAGIKGSDWRKMKKSKQSVTLPNGRKLTLVFRSCPKNYRKEDGKKRLVIMSHGFNSVASFMLHYYAAYMEEGFDVVCFDQRGHCSAKDYDCSMGYWEAEDLVQIATLLREQYSPDAIIGVQGESMGSGTGAFASHRLDSITDFCLLDCGYSTMDNMAKWIEHLTFFFPKKVFHDLVDELSAVDGKRYSDIDGLGELQKTKADYPMLFIHGSIDFFVATHFSKEMAAAKPGNSELKIYPLAFHALSQTLYPKKYKELVRSWLKKNGIN